MRFKSQSQRKAVMAKLKKWYILYPRQSNEVVIRHLTNIPTEKRYTKKFGFAEGGYKTKDEAINRARYMGKSIPVNKGD
jgi:hypothetical protein